MKNLKKAALLFWIVITICVFRICSGISEEVIPVINEIMSSNSTTIQDEDGDYPDWVELFNPWTIPIDLTGYGLSDRESNPFKWVFPPCILNPSEYKLIFASGKNRTDVPAHWETVITEGDVWRYFIGVSEPLQDWVSPGFDDAGWLSGPSGFGFGDNGDTTIVPQTISLFIRTVFKVDDIRNITHAFLHIDYDDAFVAYINGTEIARSNIGGEIGVPPAYNTPALLNREPFMYRGGAPEVYKIEYIQSLLVPGENVLAIQVHNGYASKDMTAIPFLTLGMRYAPANPSGVPDILQSSIESICLHTNFKIDASGETLVLSDSTGKIIERIDTGNIPTDHSRGRPSDGGTEWMIFPQPTPGISNNTPGFQDLSAPVQASIPGGFYDNSISLALTTDSPTAVIFYTLDGNDPSVTSTKYTAPINISKTTVVKARPFDEGFLPGRIMTHTYFINEISVLTVISLSTPPANLWDPEIGIYTKGNYTNYNQDWERPLHVELYEPNGNLGFSVDAGMAIVGQATRTLPQKSLAIFARGKYGYSEMNHQIFPDLPITEFKSLTLRNSGNDYKSTLFRDAMMQSLVKNTEIDTQGYRPAIVYINGAYWGIHNIREKQNEDYLASHHGIDPDNVDLLEADWQNKGYAVIEGDAEHYNAMINFMENHDISDSANYEYVKTQMDMNSFIDYFVAQTYFGNFDLPGNNLKFWRPKTPGGKWRWLLFDTDLGFGLWKTWRNMSVSYDLNLIEFFTEPNGPDFPNPPFSTFLLRTLLENNEFRNEFINRFADYSNTIFRTDNVKKRINEMKAAIEPEIPRHLNRWKDTIGSIDNWNSNINVLHTFAEMRWGYVYDHIMKKFSLSGKAEIDLAVSTPGTGKIKVNTVILDTYPLKCTYFKDIPVKLTALPEPGYRFAGWTGITPADSVSISVNLTENLVATANFEPTSDFSHCIVINEINYNSSGDFNPEDWVELYNTHENPIDLSGWVLKDDDDTHEFVFPNDTLINSDSYLVLCRNTSFFHEAFPDVVSYIGDFGFGLSGTGELVRLFNGQDILVDSLTYGVDLPWPEKPDGTGVTLALLNPVLDNAFPGNWSASSVYGTPGEKNDVYIVGVDETLSDHPSVFWLGQNYPNPFNHTTTIPFNLPEAGIITIDIYTIHGQRIVKILDDYLSSG
ncbi:MAG: CotH kinase family protein, partial [Thermoplasmata archaeon]